MSLILRNGYTEAEREHIILAAFVSAGMLEPGEFPNRHCRALAEFHLKGIIEHEGMSKDPSSMAILLSGRIYARRTPLRDKTMNAIKFFAKALWLKLTGRRIPKD